MAWVQRRAKDKWKARYRAPDGNERSQMFTTKRDAEAWLDAEQTARRTGEWVDPTLGRITLRQFSENHWEPGLYHLKPRPRENNLGVARNHALPRFGDWPLAGIQPADVKAWLAEMMKVVGAKGHSTSAIRRRVMVLSLMLDTAMQDERIKRNPAKGIKLPKAERRPPSFLTAEQVSALANAIDPHYRLLVLTAGYSGLRWGELAGLSVDSVDVLAGRIIVERQLQELSSGELVYQSPKSEAAYRTVTIPRSLAQGLGIHFGCEAVQSSGLAFPTVSGRPIRSTNFRSVWRTGCNAAELEDDPGLKRLTFHELRHTAVALAVVEGGHPLQIKERMGHSSITVTMDTYGHLFPSMDEALAESLDAVLAAADRPGAAQLRPGLSPTVAFPQVNG